MTLEEAPLILGMTLLTFLARYPLLALLGRVALPGRVIFALRIVPVAGLTATKAGLVGGLAVLLFAWRWGNLLLTIVARHEKLLPVASGNRRHVEWGRP